MAYHLLNLETSEYYYCDDHVWTEAIRIAEENDWGPDGTFFDIVYQTNDQCFDSDDPGYWMFVFTSLRNESQDWDGNYIEKRNQVVLYEDTIYFAMSLDGTGVSTELIEFIRKGSFRICSE